MPTTCEGVTVPWLRGSRNVGRIYRIFMRPRFFWKGAWDKPCRNDLRFAQRYFSVFVWFASVFRFHKVQSPLSLIFSNPCFSIRRRCSRCLSGWLVNITTYS